ncbi:MAG TPA: ABC transporter ATP-binding protein [Alphaproteobacteria bacterium]|nr:ABC transporter ATP-binding protein [Alphaproteobacteria bacterium]
MSDELFQIQDVVAGYRPGLPIVHGVSLGVGEAELVTIIGPNGAGKSTLIKAIAGLIPITEGNVRLAGRNITRLDTHAMADASIAYVPQTANIFASLTIEENLMVGASALSRTTARERVAAAYDAFPMLRDYRRQKAKVLSGGQRQTLAVARALLTRPRVIMLDEPSAGLSPIMVNEVFSRLRELSAQGVSILMVEQNAKAAMAISDRTYVLAEGRNRLDGPSAALLEDPQVMEIYLGRSGRRH